MSIDKDKALQVQSGDENDTTELGMQSRLLRQNISPYLDISENCIRDYLDVNSVQFIESMRFFKLNSCTTEQVDDLALYLNEKMEKLFTAIHSLGVPVAYGIVSYKGQTNLVLGVKSKEAQEIVESFIKGVLTGIELVSFVPGFASRDDSAQRGGIVSAVPVLKINDEKQKFDISTLMRSLNGQDYTVLCIAKPYNLTQVMNTYGEIVNIRDKCFEISKKNIAEQTSKSHTDTHTDTKSDSVNAGIMVGGAVGPVGVGGNVGYSHSWSKSDAKADTEGTSHTISHDVQNGLALELMEYCDKAIERLKQGQNTGMWGMAIVYSASKAVTANIIQACLCGELAKPVDDILPLKNFSYALKAKEQILLPSMDKENTLLVPVTSAELGMVCTPPSEAVPDFELRQGKIYPMIGTFSEGVVIGNVADGYRPLENMKFALSEADLNKHTFICGITGSGKTTTVKSILTSCKKPFMVIESAKKEYRNIDIGDRPLNVYTLGKPELNCLQFNPFYIQCGINLQTHIDFLKDLFNASFSFYGPMPYILEKCLHNIYRKKGWNLTLGYHPYLINSQNAINAFDSEYLKKQYDLKAHKYLFPTMQDLKDEVKRYIDVELQYDGEVGGNVKTAMLARLDSLCVGSKGFMLNTHEPIDINRLMQENVVFELEGLADDSDKAFCVGLLVVFINEYRQVFKDEHPTEKLGLQHLLVIEEAHRLLKNVDTEKSSENMGNPKGKAVEHFTNMIAEMRSYGQGVIIAEQIPSKLAPDVIKNSSNKIIQRVVSADDQELVANTIGIKAEDSVYVGSLKTGYALCHKEGMSLPVLVKVNPVSDNFVLDGDILTKREGKMFEEINLSLIKENTTNIIESLSLKLWNSLLAQSPELVVDTIARCKQALKKELIIKEVNLVFCNRKEDLFGIILTDGVMQLLVNGVYKFNNLLSNDFYKKLLSLLTKENTDKIPSVRDDIKKGYMQEPKNRCIFIISELIKLNYDNKVNIHKSIQQYFMVQEDSLLSEIEALVREGVS